MSALGLVNGLSELGIVFEIVNGHLVQVGGAQIQRSVAKQVEACAAELGDLLAAPKRGGVTTEAIHGIADLSRLIDIVTSGPVIALFKAGDHLALTADGARIAVIPIANLPAVRVQLQSVLGGARLVSWGEASMLGLDIVDLQVPVRLLEVAGEISGVDSIAGLVAAFIGDPVTLVARASELAKLAYTTRALGLAASPVLESIETSGMASVMQVERRGALVLRDASACGIRIDTDAWTKLVGLREGNLEHDGALIQAELGVAVGDDAAIVAALRDGGIIVESAKADELESWSDEPVVAAILRARRAKSFLEQVGRPYSRLISAAPGDRLHPTFNSSGESPRISASNPAIIGTPRDPSVRRCVIPSDGCAFVEADFSASQLRIVAHELQVAKLRELFAEGVDVHRWTAARHLECEVDDVSDAQKAFGKAANFGLLYAIGVDGFRRLARKQYGLRLTENDANGLMNSFFDAFPEVFAWHDREAREPTELFVTPLGRRLHLARPGIELPARLARMIQAIEADAIKTALVELAEPLRATGGRIVMPIYDAILIEVPHEQAEEAGEILAEIMRSAMARFIPSVHVQVKTKTGTDWSFGG